jgi:hypothetical protein
MVAFLKYTHKSQGGMHLATQDAHLLNYVVVISLSKSQKSDRIVIANFLLQERQANLSLKSKIDQGTCNEETIIDFIRKIIFLL